MSPRITKSKHIRKYPLFFKYNHPKNIPFNSLAKKLGVHPNLLRGMVRSAKRNPTIYAALKNDGYTDHQIPTWFARPNEPLVYRRVAPTELQPIAELSGAEDRSKPRMGYTHPTIDVAQEESAERPSALSEPSAPYIVYRLARAPPPNPLLEEAHQLLRETIEDGMRSSLNKMRPRRTPPRMPTLEELTAILEMYKIWQEIEDEKTAQTLFIMNLMQILGTSKPFDIEEIKEFFTNSFKELSSPAHDTELIEMIEAIGDILDMIPNTGPSIELIQMTMTEIERGHKSDREAFVELAKMYKKNRRKNYDLEMLKQWNREMIENFPNDTFTF